MMSLLHALQKHSMRGRPAFNAVRPQFNRCLNQQHSKLEHEEDDGIKVTFVSADGKEQRVCYGRPGQDLMRLAHAHDVELEGACEGACACSTCHVVILDRRTFDALPEPTDDENDMLDLAFGLTATSRLGCQVRLTPALHGLRVQLPKATRNLFVDGHKPKSH